MTPVFVALWAVSAAAAPLVTAIEPSITAPEGASCRIIVRDAAGHAYEDRRTVQVPPGSYAVHAHCEMDHVVLAPPPISVRVAAGQTATPKIDVEVARVRVESRRGDVLLPAHVDLFPRGANLDEPALARVPTNQTVSVAAGQYDLVVTLADKKSPPAQVLLSKVVLSSNKKVLFADLSDGSLIATIKKDGARAEGSVRAFRPGKKRDVGLIAAGQELRLPAGRYLITSELSESFDFAAKRTEVWIRAKETTRITENFETGQLSVSVTADGKPTPASVRVSLPGAADFFNHFDAPSTVTLTPGVYDVTIVSKAAGPLGAQKIEGINVKRRGHERRTIDLTRATLTVRVTKNGRPVEFAEVDVHAVGGGAAVPPTADGAFRLWPGRYEIKATLESGAVETDGPFKVELGQRLTRPIAFDRAYVTVVAVRKKQDVPAEVFVYKQGATKPVANGSTGDKLELSPGTYDIKVVAGVHSRWKQSVRLKGTHRVEVEMPDDGHAEELPEGDLPEGDLPEGG